ncbi:uncharacterized protein LOC124444814 [Xenia sp. Carnegie-2017]|uniref:uncharacterized protein LOC124444814 n=1 Tax=Xenia sp. Carnegie-2017 TaxID=2897299 RepID=UPI001F0352A9|nr:uncharacterized protein LOC124444814 [Xenia sp. Carnegie-2017]
MMKFIVALFLLVQVIFTVIDQGEAKRVVKSKSRKPFLPSCPSTRSKYLKIAKISLLEGQRRKTSASDFPVKCVHLALIMANGISTFHLDTYECCKTCYDKFLKCLKTHANNPHKLSICRNEAFSCICRCHQRSAKKCTSNKCTPGGCCLQQQCITL